MSEQNVAVVRGMWERFLQNDAEGALAAYDSDVEWDGTNLPDGKVGRGHEAVVSHVARWSDLWETWELEVEEIVDAGGDQVIAFTHERCRSAAGLEVDERHSELYRVRDGKIAYRKGFSDAAAALEAAGLSRD